MDSGTLCPTTKQRIPRRAHVDGGSRCDSRRQDDRHHSDRRHRAERSSHGAREAQLSGEVQGRRIAKRLGNALVAPVVAYVPEGDVNPPTGHMRFAGTITLPQDVFAKVLEYAARSLKQHGFLDIALIGDNGGNQAGQQLVAEVLNEEWAGTNVRVHHVTAYYPGRGDDWAVSQGVSAADVGSHAGTHDTSSLMYLNPSMLRFDKMGPGRSGDGQGHNGNPFKATAVFGERILEMQIGDAVEQIQELRASSRR